MTQKQIQDKLGLSPQNRAALRPAPACLLETTFPNIGVHIMLFAGGPVTERPGMVISHNLKEPICLHHDIDRDSARHFKHATRFYEALAKRASKNRHIVDLRLSTSSSRSPT